MLSDEVCQTDHLWFLWVPMLPISLSFSKCRCDHSPPKQWLARPPAPAASRPPSTASAASTVSPRLRPQALPLSERWCERSAEPPPCVLSHQVLKLGCRNSRRSTRRSSPRSSRRRRSRHRRRTDDTDPDAAAQSARSPPRRHHRLCLQSGRRSQRRTRRPARSTRPTSCSGLDCTIQLEYPAADKQGLRR